MIARLVVALPALALAACSSVPATDPAIDPGIDPPATTSNSVAGASTTTSGPPSSETAGSATSATGTVPADNSSTSSTTMGLESGSVSGMCDVAKGVWVDGNVGDRSYRLILPEGVSRPPVILEFHGFSNSAAEQTERSMLGEVAAAAGIGVLAFDGSGGADQPKRWTLGPIGPDVDFIEGVVPQLLPCVDDIFVTGFSNGAAFAVILACRNTLPIRGLAPVSYATGPCPDGRSLPIVAMHGTADGTVPYDGSGADVLRTLLGLGSGPAEEVMGDWAAANGCSESSEEQIAFDVDRLAWMGCAAPTEFYRIDNGGHSWPGSGEPLRFGVTTDSISASDLIVGFFADLLS